jgi:hypothetical protein
MATWQDASGNVWLFGGARLDSGAPNGFDFYNDLWIFQPGPGVWTWLAGSDTVSTQGGSYGSQGVANANNFPGARGGAVQWLDGAGNFWLFGGFGYDGAATQHVLNDLWVFNFISQQWTWINGSDVVNAPATTPNGTAGVYGTQGVAAAGNQPGGRFAAGGWTDSGGNFWLFGGEGMDQSGAALGDLNDLWIY